MTPRDAILRNLIIATILNSVGVAAVATALIVRSL